MSTEGLPSPVTIITPTWMRHGMLFGRCIPSVQKQVYVEVEHIVVSDGPDPLLRSRLREEFPDIRYFELEEHSQERHWGNPARLLGLEYATHEYIGYCDDDDALRPDHCYLLSQSLDDNQGCGFTISQMESHSPGASFIVGYGPPSNGNVGTPMLMHRKSILDIASWGYASATEDWELVCAWINSNVVYARVNTPTVDVWPSAYR